MDREKVVNELILIISFIILFIFVLLLPHNNNNKCIKSHKEKSTCTRYQMVSVGNMIATMNNHYNCEIEVCDEYEKAND